MLKPAIARLPSRITPLRDRHGHSAKAEPWRGWYNLARWKRLRLATFDRDNFTCQCGCGRFEGDSAQLVADHIKPHRGDPALFWDPANVETWRKQCHDSKKQAAERAFGAGLG